MRKHQRPHRHGAEEWWNLKPERTHYEDAGCEVWHACLSCPLPRCIYEEPRRGSAALKGLRDASIVRLSGEGWSRNALAARYKLSPRQVFRILQQARERE
jgi:hypothetical protein